MFTAELQAKQIDQGKAILMQISSFITLAMYEIDFGIISTINLLGPLATSIYEHYTDDIHRYQVTEYHPVSVINRLSINVVILSWGYCLVHLHICFLTAFIKYHCEDAWNSVVSMYLKHCVIPTQQNQLCFVPH